MGTKKRFSLNKQFLALTTLPIIILGIIITVVSYTTFHAALSKQVNTSLENVVAAVNTHFNIMYPGDYSLLEGKTPDNRTTYDLLKGDVFITRAYDYLDILKEASGMDISIFYQDVRVLTTVRDENQDRIVGTTAHSIIVDDVLIAGQNHFYKKAFINGEPYFAHYAPLRNSDGSIVGMVFAGEPTSKLSLTIFISILPTILVAIAMIFLAAIFCYFSSCKLVVCIHNINAFLSKVALGSLNTDLDSAILTRNDELGDMGRSAVHMQHSIRTLVEQDTLTGLSNRRYADKRLGQVINLNKNSSFPFTLALGDIDWFKKVNDTYGHQCGDVILKNISLILKKHMLGKGHAARWGGEEFLLIFEDISYNKSMECLKNICEEISAYSFDYENHKIQITMTFGVVEGNSQDPLNILIKKADDNLYKGKSNGRNQIVT